ncbi:MAG: response regulator [bacterium]|nr:response regulator [bacterium]
MLREKILLVDDEPALSSYLEEVVRDEGFKVRKAQSGVEALSALEEEAFLFVITDLRMPEMDGLELLRRIKERDAQIGVIVMTAFASLETAVDAPSPAPWTISQSRSMFRKFKWCFAKRLRAST